MSEEESAPVAKNLFQKIARVRTLSSHKVFPHDCDLANCIEHQSYNVVDTQYPISSLQQKLQTLEEQIAAVQSDENSKSISFLADDHSIPDSDTESLFSDSPPSECASTACSTEEFVSHSGSKYLTGENWKEIVDSVMRNTTPQTITMAIDNLRDLGHDISHSMKKRVRKYVGKLIGEASVWFSAERCNDDHSTEKFIPICLGSTRLPKLHQEVLAVLDSGASRMLAGIYAIVAYLDSIGKKLEDVEKLPSTQVFRFAGGGSQAASYRLRLPVRIMGSDLFLEVDVLEGKGANTPILISASVMREQEWLLDLKNDRLIEGGRDEVPISVRKKVAIRRGPANLPTISLWDNLETNHSAVANAAMEEDSEDTPPIVYSTQTCNAHPVTNLYDLIGGDSEEDQPALAAEAATAANPEMSMHKAEQKWAKAKSVFCKRHTHHEGRKIIKEVQDKVIEVFREIGIGARNLQQIWPAVRERHLDSGKYSPGEKELFRAATELLVARTWRSQTKCATPRSSTRVPTSATDWCSLDTFMWGSSWYLMCTNLFTRFTVIQKVKCQGNTDEVLDFFEYLDRHNLLCKNVLTDPGPQFTSRRCGLFLRNAKRRHHVTAGQSHWSNGAAERRVRCIKEGCARFKALLKDPAAVAEEKIVQHIVSQMNELPSATLKGRTPKAVQHIGWDTIVQLPGIDIENASLEEFEGHATTARKALTDVLTDSKFRSILDKCRPQLKAPAPYKAGDIVEFYDEDSKSWAGPATVVGNIDNSYWICSGSAITARKRSFVQLRPALTNAILTIPPGVQEVRIRDLDFDQNDIFNLGKQLGLEPKDQMPKGVKISNVVEEKSIPSKEDDNADLEAAVREVQKAFKAEEVKQVAPEKVPERKFDVPENFCERSYHVESDGGQKVHIHWTKGEDHSAEDGSYHYHAYMAEDNKPKQVLAPTLENAIKEVRHELKSKATEALTKANLIWDIVGDRFSTGIMVKLVASKRKEVDRRRFSTPEKVKTLVVDNANNRLFQLEENMVHQANFWYLHMEELVPTVRKVTLADFNFNDEQLRTGRVDITEEQAKTLGLHEVYIVAVVKEIESIRKQFRACSVHDETKITDPEERAKVAKAVTSRLIVQAKFSVSDFSFNKLKARLVARGFQDQRANDINNWRVDAEVVSDAGLRVMAQVAASNSKKIRCYDFDCAFLQGDFYLDPKQVTYMRLPHCLTSSSIFGFNKNSIMRCDKSLYGLKDAPAAWRAKIRRVLVSELGFREIQSDCSVFILEKDPAKRGPLRPKSPSIQNYYDIAGELQYEVTCPDNVLALVALHVDDAFCVADDSFWSDPELWGKVSSICSAGSAEIPANGPVVYLGKELKQSKDFSVSMSMDHYPAKLKPLVIPEEIRKRLERGEVVPFTERKKDGKCTYQSYIGALRWCAGLRYEHAYLLSLASSQAQSPTYNGVMLINDCIKILGENPILPTVFGPLKNPTVVGVSDANLGVSPHNKTEGSSQTGSIILLAEDSDMGGKRARVRGTCIMAKSTIQRRKASSSTGSELLALRSTEALAAWILGIGKEVGLIARKTVHHVVTDARDVQASASGSKKPREINLTPDYFLLRAKIKQNLCKIWHVAGKRNPADCLTKSGPTAIATLRIMVNSIKTNIWDLSSN